MAYFSISVPMDNTDLKCAPAFMVEIVLASPHQKNASGDKIHTYPSFQQCWWFSTNTSTLFHHLFLNYYYEYNQFCYNAYKNQTFPPRQLVISGNHLGIIQILHTHVWLHTTLAAMLPLFTLFSPFPSASCIVPLCFLFFCFS